MKILIINLALDAARMDFQRTQMQALGLEFERLEATTPDTVTPHLNDPRWNTWQRPLKDVEKALLSSHRHAWARIVAEGKPCLVLEDDAYLSASLPRFLDRVAGLSKTDHITLEARNRKKLIANAGHASLPMHRIYQDRSGAAAYILWPKAAEKLLSRHAALADALLCAAYDFTAWQAVPALAIQLDQCDAYGLVQPFKTRSAPLTAAPVDRSNYGFAARAGFRFRRIVAQLRMGLRQARNASHAQKQMIAIADDIGAWGP